MDVAKIALELMGDNYYPLVTYDIDIEDSDYDSKQGVIRLGRRCKDDYRDYAIIAEEVCHAIQDREGYWAMRLAKIGIFSKVWQYFAEKDAKKMALELLWMSEKLLVFELEKVEIYYKESLKKYRKEIFGA